MCRRRALSNLRAKMIVEGDFIQQSGEFILMGNETVLEVKGNMEILGDSIFRMHYVSSKAIIDGNFTMRSTKNHGGQLLAGTMEIKGIFCRIAKKRLPAIRGAALAVWHRRL